MQLLRITAWSDRRVESFVLQLRRNHFGIDPLQPEADVIDSDRTILRGSRE